MNRAGTGTDRLVIPTSVAAPEPGWFTSADVVVIGSGVAVLACCYQAVLHGRVLLGTSR